MTDGEDPDVPANAAPTPIYGEDTAGTSQWKMVSVPAPGGAKI